MIEWEEKALWGERRLFRLIVVASDSKCINTQGAVSLDFMPAEETVSCGQL